MDYAFSFYESTSIASESSYQYTARDGTGKSSYTTAIPAGCVTGYRDCSGASSLQSALQTGPAPAAVQADQSASQRYSGGVLPSGRGTSLDHGVLAAGLDTSAGYCLVKNSWGSSWAPAGVTQIKDQGQRGSCRAFSSTGGVEGRWEVATGSLKSLSEQQLVDCSKQNSGCNGGLMNYAFSFYESTSIASESSYPYSAREGTCKISYTTAIPAGCVTGYKDCSGASSLQSALQTGSVSVAVQAVQLF